MINHFENLLPDLIFESVQQQGYQPTGALIPLNSYENRVYQIPLEDHETLVGKYYRPGRWSIETLCDEHRFIQALVDVELPVVQALPLRDHLPESDKLGKLGGYYYAIYPKFMGREHADITNDDRKWLGRTLGRLHNVGESFKPKDRLELNPQTYGYNSLDFILSQEFLPNDLKEGINQCLLQSLKLLEPFFNEDLKAITVHGDCHPGNILWNNDGPHLLDFDDMVVAPPVQDLWMLFHGSDAEKKEQRKAFFEGYSVFREFDENCFILTEPLRTLRMIHYAAWIGKRYSEPAFQRVFPYYEQRRYWEEFLQSIKEQIALLQELHYQPAW